MNSTSLLYRTSAAASESGLGLLIALYDTLADDLLGAADAQRANDIERRCQKANHALLVLGHLEIWLANGSSGQLNSILAAFYVKMRHQILEAQLKQSSEILEEQIREILRVRAFWQELEEAENGHTEMIQSGIRLQESIYGTCQDQSTNNWSA
jgi:flagellin-specific chaperone FliS